MREIGESLGTHAAFSGGMMAAQEVVSSTGHDAFGRVLAFAAAQRAAAASTRARRGKA